MSFRVSPEVQVSTLRVVSVTSAAMSMSRTTNATSSSMSVMPGEWRWAIGNRQWPEGHLLSAIASCLLLIAFFLAVFMVQRLGGTVVLDLDFLDLRGAL